jgi:hypothetical protein
VSEQPLSNAELAELETLSKAATRVGAWGAFGPCVVGINTDGRTEQEEAYDIIPASWPMMEQPKAPENWSADYAYIAAACNALPRLLADLAAANKRVQELEQELLPVPGQPSVWELIDALAALDADRGNLRQQLAEANERIRELEQDGDYIDTQGEMETQA